MDMQDSINMLREAVLEISDQLKQRDRKEDSEGRSPVFSTRITALQTVLLERPLEIVVHRELAGDNAFTAFAPDFNALGSGVEPDDAVKDLKAKLEKRFHDLKSRTEHTPESKTEYMTFHRHMQV